jgi:hypothetical protein
LVKFTLDDDRAFNKTLKSSTSIASSGPLAMPLLAVRGRLMAVMQAIVAHHRGHPQAVIGHCALPPVPGGGFQGCARRSVRLRPARRTGKDKSRNEPIHLIGIEFGKDNRSVAGFTLEHLA